MQNYALWRIKKAFEAEHSWNLELHPKQAEVSVCEVI